MGENINRVIELVNEAAVYVPMSCEGIRIDSVCEDAQCFYGTGEETGESYTVQFDEVDLDEDSFYKLVKIN